MNINANSIEPSKRGVFEDSQQTTQYLEKQLKQMKITDQSSQQQKHRIMQNQRHTPLTFKINLGSSYLISYKASQCLSNLFKNFMLVVFCLLMSLPLLYFQEIGQKMKFLIRILMYSIPALYFILFFLDPGTLFQDQDQTFTQQRIYCLTCQIYRNLSTRHCSFCNKCCQKYDHHCSVFGKCIGKRNIFLFYLFLINVGLTFILYFIGGLYQLVGLSKI